MFPNLRHGCLLSILIVCVCVLGEDCPNWMVPISICTSEDPSCSKIKVLMDQPELPVIIPNLGPDKWVKVRSLSPCMCAVNVTISIVVVSRNYFYPEISNRVRNVSFSCCSLIQGR